MKNKALRNHVIKSFQEIEEGICELQCYLEPNCVSYNYGPSLCELNDMTHLEAQSSDMEERDGCIYRLISHVSNTGEFLFSFVYLFIYLRYLLLQNPCMSNPCLNGATCQTGFGCQGYRCACLQGYQGILCELGRCKCMM